MALFQGDAERIEIWAEERCAELERGRLDAVLAALRSLAGVCEKVRHYAGCVERNRERWATRNSAHGGCAWARGWWRRAAGRRSGRGWSGPGCVGRRRGQM